HLPRPIAVLAALALGFALAVVPAAGAGLDAAMGSDGELYFVRQGTFGELFPGLGLADPSNAALALDVIRPGSTSERFLVPGTETADVEDSASILLEDHSGTLFVLWQTMIRAIHSRLVLIGFHDGEWTEPIEISGSFFGWKSSPQLAVTRDSYGVVAEDGGIRTLVRTVVHLLWWEEGVAAVPEVFYTPVVFLDGRYTGWNPVYRLDELLQRESGQPPLAINLALAEAPRIEPGRDEQSVVVGFVDGSGGRLSSLEIEVLPGEISFIADRIRAQIIEVGRAPKPGPQRTLAEKVAREIGDLGNLLGLNPALASYLADTSRDEVLAGDSYEPIAGLADKIRAQIIEVGSRITDRGFDRLAAKSSFQVVELPNGDGAGEPGGPPNLIRLTRATIRPVPATGIGEHYLFLSRDGRQAVVSWLAEGAVNYRESRGDGWSAARQLRLGGELDLGRAHLILKQRVDERTRD
ncbi:MAG TPA: hypothetical protein VLF66_05410, partial [Thermoanaerobaculia bacterium]|nr:hypothetical protein [Thermoanaerobaculia bacterium]